MLAFFHGWRRKAGCVTLMMACVFMAAWVRSWWATDMVGWSSRDEMRQLSVMSEPGSMRLEWDTTRPGDEFRFFEWGWPGFDSYAYTTEDYVAPTADVVFFDYEFSSSGQMENRFNRFLIIPFRSIVIPLSLLSALLLLSKSRLKKAAPPTAPLS